ncbi:MULTISPECIES: hypothetical protein [Lactobacillus]|uniref:Lactococcin 972 family bacteriocin n=1 Tax=Lactobacillus xujianguonis TaxID=2495899 RepID=A0A437SX89_9LACO|nr:MULTISPECIES: hypothetical protein [Lactobacillus]RVU71470.1 hypothetical protein EJK17_01855 [Lactobacillus xujianguonis]RVU73693.1 hypothetical protein EJK20_06905 [Lactobacillus xujianguonis]
MKKKILFATLLLFLGLGGLVSSKSVNAADTDRVHFGFRWYNPDDTTYRQQKWTKSGYYMKSNTVTVPWYTAAAWGHSYKAGRTGEVDVSEGHSVQVHQNTTYNLYNKLVEWYGTGNNAYIKAWSYSNGSAWGYWHADH